MLDRLEWTDLPPAEAKKLAALVLFQGNVSSLGRIDVSGQAAGLSFYEFVRLVRLVLRIPADETEDVKEEQLFLLEGEDAVHVLDGTSGPIHKVNFVEEIRINPETAPDYLRFFCFAVRGDEGPFLLYEKSVSTPDEDETEALAEVRTAARPLKAEGQDESGRYLFEVPVKYASALFVSRFSVGEDGSVLVLEDEPILADVPPDPFPTLPELRGPALVLASLERHGAVAPRPHGPHVLRILVELLLEEALEAKRESRLLSHFNAKLSGGAPVDRFAHFVATASPVVAIESTLPFVEETVARIVSDRVPEVVMNQVHGKADPPDDMRIVTSVPDSGPALVLLSFHSYRQLGDAERVSHELATREVSCLIGCERVADLPDSLRQVVDVTLPLPRFDPPLFKRLFRRVVGASLPENWTEGDEHWVNHVLHTDFHHPMGLELSPDETLDYIRGCARERLRNIEPAKGLRLSELHGLGEARAFAEDLIADIHEAVAGRLDWRHVDRGVLLVGEPGTGKTTLARAIAKDCGIRFVNASASGWQAAGHLGDHIRAMRSDFAQARRFAPAILFIDEIDSVGSRETFSGQNAQYSTEVVNALLEQIGGLDPEAPVIVIGATNHVDRVDPALKRAGRLDRAITIPRPNAKALGQIYEHYLQEYTQGALDPDVDARELGRFSLGTTGADVELFVRGAARRARRAGREIRQRDLFDEITRKPRDPESSPRLTPEDVRRVAVHEAGHALASCLTSSGGEEISFVTIVPRADGSLGFVAFLPSERMTKTRKEYLEQLEVLLGGRAAEEIVSGEDGVTAGAGGGSRTSDLAMATAWALQMITRYGLGKDRNLRWSDAPQAAQLEQADELLRDAYVTVLTKLRGHEPELLRIVETLIERQELRGEELRTIVARAD